ncbi:ATP-binding protein [Aquimarina sp. U1-2]|uniref:AAA family ATPase n=1 Tax=Aquimarina sp. U1-2 TaxID=2823141 RepID=UPI001AEC7EF1|nr:ATP-binding protein [Aquimarina sp. U1-2]MBP2832073.1 ATP-binding protein [Aquimarina sp. U1-2]
MTQKRIVITGAPGTGKTSIVVQLEKLNFFCFHEVIRQMTQEAQNNNEALQMVSNPIVSVADPYQFNTTILEARVQQFKDASFYKKDIIFYDRGIPDVIAYMDYFEQSYESSFTNSCKRYRYDYIFILPPWKEIYKADEERFESFEQAQEIHHHLYDTYTQLGYHCIEVPFGHVEERSNFILQTVS